jgi:transposase
LNPDSREGRLASPIAQGWVQMDAIYGGIDVSKDRLDVHLRPSGEAFAVARDGKGLEDLVARLQACSPTLIAVEATGGFETIVAAALAGAQLPLVVVNPAQIRHFAQAVGQRAKTDPIDAAVIARFVEAVKPTPRAMPDQEARLLAELVSRRRQIIEMIVAERQREKRAENVRVRKSLARHIKVLEKELLEIDNDIDTLVRGSPVWRAKEELLVSFPGVSNTLARTFLAEVPELGTLNRRQIASLAGLAPFTRQSGRWKGKSMIGGGRAALRAGLYMAALSASRYHPQLKLFYQRLLVAGKPKMVALIAVARKVLTILNAMLRDQKQWQPA